MTVFFLFVTIARRGIECAARHRACDYVFVSFAVCVGVCLSDDCGWNSIGVSSFDFIFSHFHVLFLFCFFVDVTPCASSLPFCFAASVLASTLPVVFLSFSFQLFRTIPFFRFSLPRFFLCHFSRECRFEYMG
jgi:hypothetical protein